MVLKDLRDYDEAETYFLKAIYFDSTYSLAMRNLGDIYLKQQKTEKAILWLEKARIADPKSLYGLYWLGRAHVQNNNIQQGIKCFLEVLAEKPDLPQVNHDLGKAYFANRNYKKALDHVQYALKRNSSMIPYYITLSHIYDHMHQEKKAFAALQDALTIDRSVAEIYIERGNIHKNAGRFEDALKEYNLAALIKPELWLSHYKSGVALYYLTRLDEAETAFLKAEELQSENGSIYHFLGMVSLARDNNKAAENRLLEAAELDDTNGDIWFHLGEVQMRTEQWEDAENSLLKSYDIDSYNSETLYSLGQVYKKLGKLDRSLEYLYKFKEVEEFERNTESLNKRIRLHPNDITLRLRLATLYEDQNRVDQAVPILRQAAYLGSIEAENKLKTILEKIRP